MKTLDTFPRCFDVYSRLCLPSVSPIVQYLPNKDKMNFSTLRNIQGLHAPLKLQMEYRAARQVCRVKSIILPLTSFQCLIDVFDPQPFCLFFTDSAFAILIEFKPGSGHAARQRREHRFRGHSQWSGCWSIALLLARRAS